MSFLTQEAADSLFEGIQYATQARRALLDADPDDKVELTVREWTMIVDALEICASYLRRLDTHATVVE